MFNRVIKKEFYYLYDSKAWSDVHFGIMELSPAMSALEPAKLAKRLP
jgi:hypothetical protein